MAWIAQLDLVAAANALVILITGLAVGLGLKRGAKMPPTSLGSAIEVAGALVDSASIRLLTAAIEAQNVEQALNRQDAERGRKFGHELVEALQDLTKELSEIRNEMRLKRR